MNNIFFSILFILSIGFNSAIAASLSSSACKDWQHYVQNNPDDYLFIFHFDVEQGDSTLIRLPNGKTILIDAGLSNKGREIVIPMLEEMGLTKLDYVVVSHYDVDHYGGIMSLFDEVNSKGTPFKIKRKIYDPGNELMKDNTQTAKYLGYFQGEGPLKNKRKTIPLGTRAFGSTGPVKITVKTANGKVHGGKAVDVRIKSGKNKGKAKDDNSISISMTLKYGKFDYYIGGDLTGGGNKTPNVEGSAAKSIGDIDVYRANHHGSKTSNSLNFLKALKPEVAVVSVGDGVEDMAKRYKLPTESVISEISDLKSVKDIFMTSPPHKSLFDYKDVEKVVQHFNSVKKFNHIAVVASPSGYCVNDSYYRTDKK